PATLLWTMNKRRSSLFHSFRCALCGIFHALTRERNLRMHTVAGACVEFFARYYELSAAECAVLALCIGLVIACELINTAVENGVALTTAAYHARAKTAEDAAAGAVLVSAITSVVVGFLLLWNVPVLQTIAADPS